MKDIALAGNILLDILLYKLTNQVSSGFISVIVIALTAIPIGMMGGKFWASLVNRRR